MKIRAFFLSLAGVVCLFSTMALGDIDPILGKAGDCTVKKSELERLIRFYSSEDQKTLGENPEERTALVRRMLEIKVISDLARKDKLDENPEVKEQLQYMIDDFLAQEYISRVVMKGFSLSDEKLREFYNVNQSSFAVPEMVRAGHILVNVSPNSTKDEKNAAREKTEKLLSRLKGGEDFAKIAEESSEDPDPDMKKHGGDLGYFARGQMIKPIEDAAFSTKPGEITDVIETQYGYMILKIEDHKEPRPRAFEEVKDSIKARLQDEFSKLKAQEFISKASQNAGMVIYEEEVEAVTPGE